MDNYKGIIFKEKIAKLAANRKVTIFISSENYKKYIGDELLIVSGKKAHALVNLGKAVAIDLKTFTAQLGRHGITEEERKKWWGKKRKFYSYRIRYIENYSPELDISYEKPKGIFISNINIRSDEKHIVEEDFGESDVEAVLAAKRSNFEAPKHPLAVTLDDLIGHVDKQFVDEVLNDSSSSPNERRKEIDRERSVNRQPGSNPNSIRSKVDKFRQSIKRGGLVRVEEPKNVTKIREQVKSMSLQERFRAKLGGK